MSKESRELKKQQRAQLKKLPFRERVAAARRLAEAWMLSHRTRR